MVDVIRSDISNSIGAVVTRLDISIPPMRQGKAKILRSLSFSCLPINAGMNDCLIIIILYIYIYIYIYNITDNM